MAKDSYRRVDQNIYVETRRGTHRFQVGVFPLKRVSRTFDVFAEGIAWALAERERILQQKTGGAPAPGTALAPILSAASAGRCSAHGTSLAGQPDPRPSSEQPGTVCSPQTPSFDPGSVQLATVLAAFARDVSGALADQSEVRARLRRLTGWFGHLALKDLTRDALEDWMDRRLAGELGAGRGSGRDRPGAPVLTKDQRSRARQAGQPVVAPTQSGPAPVSSQTVRHELGYLRRAVRNYFERDGRGDAHALWLASQPVMRIELPQQATPRDRRISDEELRSILARMSSRVPCFAIMFAIASGLRRAEVASLLWQDLDVAQRVIRLRQPAGTTSVRGPRRARGRGAARQTKTHERTVPLTPLALKVLTTYGLQTSGRIFPRAAASLTQAWRRAADRVGLVDARLHDCRREAVSRLVDEFDLPVEKVALFTGHRDLAVLRRHYLRPSAEKLADMLAQRDGVQSGIGLVHASLGGGSAD